MQSGKYDGSRRGYFFWGVAGSEAISQNVRAGARTIGRFLLESVARAPLDVCPLDDMKPVGRLRQALLRALAPTIATGVISGLFAIAQILRGGRSVAVAMAVAAGLTVVVFLTYFSSSLGGYRVKSEGTVDIPASRSWLLVSGLTIVVMAAALFLASRFE